MVICNASGITCQLADFCFECTTHSIDISRLSSILNMVIAGDWNGNDSTGTGGNGEQQWSLPHTSTSDSATYIYDRILLNHVHFSNPGYAYEQQRSYRGKYRFPAWAYPEFWLEDGLPGLVGPYNYTLLLTMSLYLMT